MPELGIEPGPPGPRPRTLSAKLLLHPMVKQWFSTVCALGLSSEVHDSIHNLNATLSLDVLNMGGSPR